jgi:hypothetical protein
MPARPCCALLPQVDAEEGEAGGSGSGSKEVEEGKGEGPDLDAVMAQEQAELDWWVGWQGGGSGGHA